MPILFRPGGAFASQAADVSIPFNQSLFFGGVDHQTLGLEPEHGVQVRLRAATASRTSASAAWPICPTGMKLNRDNWNVTVEHTWTIGSATARTRPAVQVGQRRFEEPNNSDALAECFSSGNTLQTARTSSAICSATANQWECATRFHRTSAAAAGRTT